jgi:hypothetical protein
MYFANGKMSCRLNKKLNINLGYRKYIMSGLEDKDTYIEGLSFIISSRINIEMNGEQNNFRDNQDSSGAYYDFKVNALVIYNF